MAKKDTMNALLKRGITEETVALLLTQYTSLDAIRTAGEEEIVKLGISEDEAKDVIQKLGAVRSSSTSSRSK